MQSTPSHPVVGANRTCEARHRAAPDQDDKIGPASTIWTKYLAWVEPYRVSDRIAPELLTTPNPLGYWLQYPAFTDLPKRATALAAYSAFWSGGTIVSTFSCHVTASANRPASA